MDVYSSSMNANSAAAYEDTQRKNKINPLLWNSQRSLTGKLYCNKSSLRSNLTKVKFYSGVYHSFGQCNNWSNLRGNPHNYGAIFNFDFTPDGSTLVAASERRSILMFDPLSQKMYRAKTDAHDNCVNVIKFIDSRLFATCSDDRTVKIWDLRNTEKELQTLHGHSNWVKNIECINNKLITSGFDGNIIVWDYNKMNDQGEVPHQTLFQTRNLMRTALSADSSKLIMSTSSGYIMVMHDLDIDTIADDLNGFKPNIYRLMSMTPRMGSDAIPYNHLFQTGRNKNRLELITDFTDNIDVEIIASLKIHPSGNYIVSRNTSSDEKSEHTCVHDLRHSSLRKRCPVEEEVSPAPTFANRDTTFANRDTDYIVSLAVEHQRYGEPSTNRGRGRARTRTERIDRPATVPDGSRLSRSRSPVSRSEIPSQEANEVLARVLPSTQQRIDHLTANNSQNNDQYMIFIQGGSDGVHQTVVLFADEADGVRRKQRSNTDSKLSFYVEEPNMGRGFIKEQCFSNDGRIVCSPFAHGVRLLGFDSECREIEEKMEGPEAYKSGELQEISSIYTHQNLVVSTKYSPTHHLLVTGCLDGQVSFHQPVF